MRKTIISILALMLTLSAMAERVSPEAARRAAATFLGNNGRSAVALNDVSRQAGFANLYIFSSDSSFVILSADDRVQPILGYSLTGRFIAEGMPDHIRWWLQGYDDGIQAVVDAKCASDPKSAEQWHALLYGHPDAARAEVIVAPLVTTKWDQGNPFNSLCPSGCVTGCVATAMAQIMNYWESPMLGMGTHSYVWNNQTLSADFGVTFYDWANMKDSYSTFSEEEKQAVATLLFQCGVSTEMKYSLSGSGTTNKRASFALRTFFNYEAVYHKKSEFQDDTVWVEMLKSDLDNGCPVLYGGKGSLGGHSFVCDGYDSDGNFHFNFGWSGGSDGFYALSANHFPDLQDAVFNIRQKPCDAQRPTGLSYSAEGCHVTLLWDGVENAESYNVYRNDVMIANVSATNYADVAVLGDNRYFVRSVDAASCLSLPSNVVTVAVAVEDYPQPVVDDLSLSVTGPPVTLSWFTPWWFPRPGTESETLSYVERTRPEVDNVLVWKQEGLHLYWGIKFAADDLGEYDGKALFDVAFYVNQPSDYQVLVYQGTLDDAPQDLKSHQSAVTCNYGWVDVKLDEPVIVDSTRDLWVFILDNGGIVAEIPVLSYDNVVGSPHGQYYGGFFGEEINYPHEYCAHLPEESFNCDWLIVAYLTDDYYTYNLYRDGEVLASEIADTQYTDNDLEDGTYTYHVTTNYYVGESEPSNAVSIQKTVVDGSTWWSPTVDVNLAALEAALDTNASLINSQDGGFAKRNGDTWSGTLSDIQPGQMYKIHTDTATTLAISGTRFGDTEITLVPGHNWIGFAGTTPMMIGEALGDFTPAEGDTITDKDGHTASYNGGSWNGDLTTLQPGQGYVYHSNDTTNRTLSLP